MKDIAVYSKSPRVGMQAAGASFGDHSGGGSRPPVRPAAGFSFREDFAAWAGCSVRQFLVLLTALGGLLSFALYGLPLILAGLGLDAAPLP